MNKNNIKMIKKYGAKIVCYSDLPQAHQLAIARWMTIDCESWPMLGKLAEEAESVRATDYRDPKKWDKYMKDLNNLLKQSIHLYARKYANKKISIVEIPTVVIKKEMMKRSEDLEEAFSNWDEYHRWYAKNNRVPNHSDKDRWPCILSGFNDEVVEDGVHRLHCYIKQGVKKIPCVFY